MASPRFPAERRGAFSERHESTSRDSFRKHVLSRTTQNICRHSPFCFSATAPMGRESRVQLVASLACPWLEAESSSTSRPVFLSNCICCPICYPGPVRARQRGGASYADCLTGGGWRRQIKRMRAGKPSFKVQRYFSSPMLGSVAAREFQFRKWSDRRPCDGTRSRI
jgi:hypothetical protein